MAVQRVRNVRMAGVAAAVPTECLEIKTAAAFADDAAGREFSRKVGIERVRRHSGGKTCADFCEAAAEKLMSELGWHADEVDLLVFSAQSRDYVQPATACVLHGKLGLSVRCACFDVALDCSGWVYGVSILSALMQSGDYKKALLLCGGSEPTGESHPTRADLPLFGDAGTATAFVAAPDAPELVTDMRTDGTGYEAIIYRSGGLRHPVTPASLEYHEDTFGHRHRDVDMEMDGASVFIFATSRVPGIVADMLHRIGRSVEQIDYFLFHQANLMINERIRRKCNIPSQKCPLSLHDFGNTNSGTIPLTIVTRLRDPLREPVRRNLIACGFGVGLSWGAVYLQTDSLVIPPLIEL